MDIGTQWPLLCTLSIQAADCHNVPSFWHKSYKTLSEWHLKLCGTGSRIRVSSTWILQLVSTDSASPSRNLWKHDLRLSNGLLQCSHRITNCVSIAYSISTAARYGFEKKEAKPARFLLAFVTHEVDHARGGTFCSHETSVIG